MASNVRSLKIPPEKVAEILKEKDNFVIISHADPDGDTIGSAHGLYFALKLMGKKAKIKCNNSFHKKYEYLTQHYQKADDNNDEDFIISVDVADAKLLGENLNEYKTRIDLAIDHHFSHRDFAKKLCLNGEASAAALVVYEIIMAMHIQLTRLIANALYTAIATDTGCFKFSNTTPQAHIVAAEFLRCGCEYDVINRLMFETKSIGRIELEKLVLDSLKLECSGKCAIITITNEMFKQTGTDSSDIDGIVAIPRQIEGVEVGIAIKQRDDCNGKESYKASVRTNQTLDASKICGEFGGGGHVRASGCTFVGTLKEFETAIVSVVEKYLTLNIS